MDIPSQPVRKETRIGEDGMPGIPVTSAIDRNLNLCLDRRLGTGTLSVTGGSYHADTDSGHDHASA
jgi:hypothetical protein